MHLLVEVPVSLAWGVFRGAWGASLQAEGALEQGPPLVSTTLD